MRVVVHNFESILDTIENITTFNVMKREKLTAGLIDKACVIELEKELAFMSFLEQPA